MSDLGAIDGEDKVRWDRLKVIFEPGNPGVPGEWFVLYINTRTGLIDPRRVVTNARALHHTAASK